MATAPAYGAGQVDAAAHYVAEEAIRGGNQLLERTDYTQVFRAAGMDDPFDLIDSGQREVITQFMFDLHHHCLAQNLPPLDSLVVQAGTATPGHGYFQVNNVRPGSPEADALLWRQQEECIAWGKEQRALRRGRRPSAPPAPAPAP